VGNLIVTLAWVAAATAADCPRHGTLGTSRILSVDAVTTPRVGLKSFSQTLPLGDHEVVLTFDDGPMATHDGAGTGGPLPMSVSAQPSF